MQYITLRSISNTFVLLQEWLAGRLVNIQGIKLAPLEGPGKFFDNCITEWNMPMNEILREWVEVQYKVTIPGCVSHIFSNGCLMLEMIKVYYTEITNLTEIHLSKSKAALLDLIYICTLDHFVEDRCKDIFLISYYRQSGSN